MEKYGKSNKNNYIVDVLIDEKKNLIQIVFADGKTSSVKKNKNNLSKLVKIMEKQKEEGLKDKRKYVAKSIASSIASIGSAIIASGSISLLQDQISSQTDEVVASTILVGGSLVCGLLGVSAGKSLRKVSELNKLEYLKENKSILTQMNDYTHSLDGLSRKKKKLFEEKKNPLSIIYAGKYTKNDLERIVYNIEREAFLRANGIDDHYVGEVKSEEIIEPQTDIIEPKEALPTSLRFKPYVSSDSIFTNPDQQRPKTFTKKPPKNQ